MVKNLWLLLWLFGCVASSLAHAESRLSIKLDKKELVLGEPLILELKAMSLNAQ